MTVHPKIQPAPREPVSVSHPSDWTLETWQHANRRREATRIPIDAAGSVVNSASDFDGGDFDGGPS